MPGLVLQEGRASDVPTAERVGPAFARTGEHPSSIAEYVAALVALSPDGEVHQIDQFGRRTSESYGSLFRRALALSERLPRTPHENEPVAVLGVTDVLDHIVGGWACLMAGFDLHPVDTALSFSNPQEFMRKMLRTRQLLRPSVVLVGRTIEAAMAKAGVSDDFPPVVSVTDDGGGALPEISRFRPAARHSRFLIATSGTTGEPRIAVIDNLSATNRFFDGLRQDERSCLYTVAHSSVAGLRLLLPLGRRVVYLHPLRLAAAPAEWFRTVCEHAVTDAGLSSSTASMLLGGLAAQAGDLPSLSSLCRLSFGAETIVPEIVGKLLLELDGRAAGTCSVSFVYSMTETGPIYRTTAAIRTAIWMLEDVSTPVALSDCVPGWSVRCVDERDCVVREGEAGVVQVRSESKAFAGYSGQEQPVSGNGWFHTGDVGAMSGGALTLKGREKSTIIVNARKVTCEEIETRLRANKDLRGLQVIVAPFRETGAATDSVAVFVVDAQRSGLEFARLKTEIVADVARNFGLSVRHVVPVREDEVERTTTMKVRRDSLLSRYPGQEGPSDPAARSFQSSGAEQTMLGLWKRAIELKVLPELDSDFFDLGGDSLAAARLLAAAEDTFARQVDIDAFFSDPTPRRLLELLSVAPEVAVLRETKAVGPKRLDGARVLKALKRRVADWEGVRTARDSMIVGFNVSGSRPPLFWVSQSQQGVAMLAGALGEDQPVYALRSARGILRAAEYSEPLLRDVVDRYFWELLSIATHRTFSLGGSCQGGMIALLLAKRLVKIGREPRDLFLADWHRDFARYGRPVHILLSSQSPVWAGLNPVDLEAHQKRFFPEAKVTMLDVGHGETLRTGKLHHLVAFLGPHLEVSVAATARRKFSRLLLRLRRKIKR